VKIDSWARPWNAASERPIGGIPASSYWAIDPAGIDQIGCIYSAQGFEYDWSGVIIGPDLVFRDGRLVGDPSRSKDWALNDPTLTPDAADQLIRNTYKVLLTRGLKGVLIYATDERTQRHLSELVPSKFSRLPQEQGGVARSGRPVEESERPGIRSESPGHRQTGPADTAADPDR
jgi:hypothetical protein